MRLMFAAAAALLIGTAHALAAAAFVVGGTAIELSLPKEFCFLSRENPGAKPLYEMQDRAQAKRNLVVALVAPCSSISGLKSDGFHTDWGMWLAQTTDGRVVPIPDSYSRAQVIDAIIAGIPKMNSKAVADEVAAAGKHVGVNIGIKSMGLIDRDENAGYMGIVETIDRGAAPMDLAAVIGMTELHARFVTFQYYHAYEGRRTLDDLLPKVKAVMAESAALDGSGDGGLPLLNNFDWGSLWGRVLVGAIVGGLIAGFGFLFNRSRKN
jgi:hypothetical protein